MNFEDENLQRALALLWTRDEANVAIVEALEEAGVVDLSEFWEGMQELEAMQYMYSAWAKYEAKGKETLLKFWWAKLWWLGNMHLRLGKHIEGAKWVPSVIETFRNLKTLRCDEGVYLSAAVGRLSWLEELELVVPSVGSVEFEETGRALASLGQLLRLKLRFEENKARLWPSGVFGLQKLDRLSIEYTAGGYIPLEVMELKNLQVLSFSGGLDVALPSAMREMNLRELTLRGFAYLNDLTALPPSLVLLTVKRWSMRGELAEGLLAEGLTKLRLLELEDFGLTRLPSSLFTGNLYKMVLNRNRLAVLPDCFDDSPNLEELSVDSNALECLPPSLLRMPKLKELEARDNALTGALDFRQAAALERLYLSNNSVEELLIAPTYRALHVENNKLKRLEGLNNKTLRVVASRNKIEEISGFADLDSLQVLNLRHNCLARLPDDISLHSSSEQFKFYGLLLLDLAYNRLTELPPCWLRGLAGNCRINLSHNRLQRLPDTAEHGRHIGYLDLSYNQLEALPDWLGGLTWIRELQLHCNHLRQLPELLAWKDLGALSLSNNNLERLPESIANLRRLTALYLHHNRLTRLPDGLCDCTKLVRLHANHNQIQQLPQKLHQLKALQKLALKGNQLRDLPPCIFEMTWLREINLTDNPLPPSLVADLRRALPDTRIIA